MAPDALGAHRRAPGHWTPAGRIAAALRRTAVRLWDDDVAALYAEAGTYNRLYGSLAGTIVFSPSLPEPSSTPCAPARASSGGAAGYARSALPVQPLTGRAAPARSRDTRASRPAVPGPVPPAGGHRPA
ncbi:hypothetical protein [Streptomyces sp. NPDC127112]|uniref:hypothetical protein n=1 Tax=Streptomyces sp. NPDC127112 TaxID=3345364 RepID=UPI00363B1367